MPKILAQVFELPSTQPLPLSLKEEAFVAVERMIVTGDLAPGQWVSETELIELTGFSRAPIRSAIDRLADQRLIFVFPRRGAQICPLDYTQQFRALELRRAVEKLIVRSAASRANDEQRALFTEFGLTFREVGRLKDQNLMTDIDAKQFKLVLEAADNPFAAKAMTSVKGLSRRFWILHSERHGDFSNMATCQANVADAIAAGSEQEAEDALDRLMDYLEKFTLKVVGYGS